ncbi:MAG: hypothetical protein M1493_00605 [Firmicutes bacterium]|nr:hypothetical protein [Bacillota bacterium]
MPHMDLDGPGVAAIEAEARRILPSPFFRHTKGFLGAKKPLPETVSVLGVPKPTWWEHG